MAHVIELALPKKSAKPKTYHVEVTQYPDNLLFVVNDIKVDSESLRHVADAFEKIAHIIRTDIVTGAV